MPEKEYEYEYEEYEDADQERELLIAGIKQKLLGVVLIVLTIVILRCGWTYDVVTGCNDATFALVTVPLGLVLMFSKHKMLY